MYRVLLFSMFLVSGAIVKPRDQDVEVSTETVDAIQDTSKPKTIISEGDVNLNATKLECSDFHDYCRSASKLNNCSCDPDCIRFGQCCWDAPTDVDNSNSETLQEPVYACRNVPLHHGIVKYNVKYNVISRCPRDWPIEDVRNRCESPYNTSPNDVFMWLPVSSNSSTYLNVFCAACHSDREVKSWLLGIGSYNDSFNQTMTYDLSRFPKFAAKPSGVREPDKCGLEEDTCNSYWKMKNKYEV